MPIHPLTVHLPIGLLLASWAFFAARLFRQKEMWLGEAAYALLLASLGGMLVSIITGRNAGADLMDPSATLRELLDLHAILAYALLWVGGLLALWAYLRRHKWQFKELTVFVLVLGLSCAMMAYSAHLGGRMVYEEGAGVERV